MATAVDGEGPSAPRAPFGLPAVVVVVALAVVAIELVCGPRYGLFRDEYYYLACADHLAWGYVDQPPLSIAVLAAVRGVLGDSLLAVRLVPALLGATLVVLGALLARALGGGRGAAALAALSIAVVPQYLGQAGYYSMNAFDLVFWAAAALVVARLSPEEQRLRPFVVLGLLLGLGLLNKVSVLFFGAGLAVALLVTPLRRLLLRPGPWLAAGIALALFLPHVLWQVANGFPTREFIENATRYKNVALGPLQFLSGQADEMNPFLTPLWVAGLLWLLFARGGRQRPLGIVYLVAFAILAAQHSKPYYLGPAYPPLLAAGCVLIDGKGWRWLKPTAAVAMLAAGAIVAPFAIPVLPVETFIAYQRALGAAPKAAERSSLGPLPQFFADRFGWQELTTAVASVASTLPPEQRARAIVVASNYGEAGALQYLGRDRGLPPVASRHNSYYFWGPGRADADVVIAVGLDPAWLRESWASVEEVARWRSPYAMPYEQRWPVLVCREPREPLAAFWRRGRRFI